ncbi:hypothetical protein CDCA_CDCA05G1480 [Cyanidium caldarium]|uniref:Homologous-pairing protein 2 winged helix domain-containing protein n=1 Tax=Cyanidium caldarium TaxID=2771 RepID=A0AAV9ITL9_CYACA|nr:hypothetical protein CDCA_CDCA05G1480 [Cyanidium caldarium]
MTARSASKKKARAGEDDCETPGKPSFGDSATEAVFAFLAEQNRPFSAQNVTDGLASRSGLKKTAVERALAELVAGSYVSCKEYGKSKVYLTLQSNIELPTPAEMEQLEAELARQTEQLDELQEACAALQAEHQRLNAAPRTEEAEARATEREQQLREAESTLTALRERARGYDDRQRRLIEEQHRTATKAWRERKRLVQDIVRQMADGMEKKPAAFTEELGLELDEEEEEEAAAPVERRPGQGNASKRVTGNRA